MNLTKPWSLVLRLFVAQLDVGEHEKEHELVDGHGSRQGGDAMAKVFLAHDDLIRWSECQTEKFINVLNEYG